MTLFKIPEARRVGLYTVSDRGSSQPDFFSLYQALGFKGLRFEEIWKE